jgi:isopentenyl diphosphate isomerase/L-lactate dehydrogenase-like FMN-dependent dehydrogenase
MPDFGAYQNEIYVAGLSGRLPSYPMRFSELEAKAHAAMPAGLVSYVAGGCGDERTQEANVEAFDKWGLWPRMFVGAKQRDLSIELFGMRLPSPLFMSPIGVLGLCAQDGHGDLATARAAALTGVPMVASTLSSDPLEAVAAEFKAMPGFFQLYTPTDRELAASLVTRAERAGFKAIVVTLDTLGDRLASARSLDRQLSTAARPLPRQLFFRPALRGVNGRAAREGPALRHCDMGCDLRQSADLGRSGLATFADQTAANHEGYLSSR